MTATRLRIVVLAGVLGLALTGAGLRAAGTAAPPTHTVVIDATSFAPKYLTVHPGETVVWVNKDILAHTATSKRTGVFDSKEIAPGKSWTFTPTKSGQFDYRCTLHATMKGTLVVR